MSKISKKDAKILFELDKNSRAPISEIAKKTRLSRDVITYRINQLQKSGIIKKFITIIDFTKFGRQIARLYIKLQNSTKDIEENITSFFISKDNIITVYKTDGKYDLAIGFLIKDMQEYQETYLAFLEKFRRFVQQSTVCFFLDYIHFHRNYLVEKRKQDYTAISTGSHLDFKHDAKDIELLNLIKENSRISLLDLAKKLKLTATGVKYKLKKLEKEKVIVAYKLLVDSTKLGFTYYKIDFTLEEMSIISGLQEFITKHPNIIYQDITVGSSDFECDGEFASEEDFYEFLDQVKSLFQEKIRSYHYYKALKIYKYSYFPESLT